MMVINSDFLKRAFQWSDEVVDAAQSPAAKLASTLLPILAPIVPAFITSIKLHGMYLELIGTNLPSWVALAGAIVTAIVLEFLGWVGTIALVRFLYQWVKTKEDEYIIPFFMSLIAYVIYIADMVSVNTRFANKDTVFLLLALFSVPAGFMFAVSLVGNEERKNDYTIRQEKREDRLKKAAIKQGINIFQPMQTLAVDTPQEQLKEPKEKHASDYKEKAIEFIEEFYGQNRSRPTPKHLTERFKLEHSKNKGYMSSLIKEVCDGHGWQ